MKNLYTDLAEFLHREQVLVEARAIHASTELAWQFEKDKKDPLKHYRESDLYMFGSTRYQMRLQHNNFHEWLKTRIKELNIKTGLDYGGGTGEVTIQAIEAGVEKMTFVEVSDSKTLDYATWRFNKHGIRDSVRIENEGFKVESDYDLIVAMDVFEHLENPLPLIEQMSRHTKYLVCNPGEVKYNWLYPQHISHFRLEPHFKQIESYLFKSTKGGEKI